MKLGSPGVPDFYQGTELWDLSLVDPDNRRPVDFDAPAGDCSTTSTRCSPWIRPARIERLAELLREWRDGRIKLLTTAVGLRLRRADPELFLDGAYVPLDTDVTVAARAVAFARVHGERAVIVVGPRLCARLSQPADADDLAPAAPLGGDRWKTSRVLLPRELGERTFHHAITGAEIKPTVTAEHAWMFLGQIFEHVPVGLLLAR